MKVVLFTRGVKAERVAAGLTEAAAAEEATVASGGAAASRVEQQYAEAETAIALADTAASLDALKKIYNQYATLKDIKVNGTTLLDTVNKKKREFV